MAVKFPQFDNELLGGSDAWDEGLAGVILCKDYFPDGTVDVTGQVKVCDGISWVAKPLKVWDGTSWAVKPLKYWDGSAWKITSY